MLNFGASKPRVRGGGRAPGAPPWIRTWRRSNVSLYVETDPSASGTDPERKDEAFCHSESNRTLSCPGDSFIDMFLSEGYSPLAVFILDFSCPSPSDRQTALSNITSDCQRDATDLLMRQVPVTIIWMFKLQ